MDFPHLSSTPPSILSLIRSNSLLLYHLQFHPKQTSSSPSYEKIALQQTRWSKEKFHIELQKHKAANVAAILARVEEQGLSNKLKSLLQKKS